MSPILKHKKKKRSTERRRRKKKVSLTNYLGNLHNEIKDEIIKKSSERRRRKKKVSPINCLGNLPNEIMNHVLTYLSYEEIDNLRLVNKKLKAACDYRLKKAYLEVKQEVELCCERIFHSKTCPGGYPGFARKMFFLFLREFLTNSFCLFDILKGYLDVKYSVNGKSIDLAYRLLWFQDVEDPLLHLVELVIGRSADHSNMKCYEDFGVAYSEWFIAKKYRGVDMPMMPKLYMPLIKKSDYKLTFTLFYDQLINQCSAVMLDILSTLWFEKDHLDKHLLWDSSNNYGGMWSQELIPVIKPNEDQDPQLYVELFINLDYSSSDEEIYVTD